MAKSAKAFQPKIGEVYMMYFSGDGNTQRGWRPGLVFQNNVGNMHSPNIIALPLTSVLKKSGQPTHVIIKAADSGLRVDSMVLCENPDCMSKCRVGEYVTTLSEKYMQEIAIASLLATSAIAFVDTQILEELQERAYSLNNVG